MKIICEYCDKKVCRKNNEPYHLKCYKECMYIEYYINKGIIFDYTRVAKRYIQKNHSFILL